MFNQGFTIGREVAGLQAAVDYLTATASEPAKASKLSELGRELGLTEYNDGNIMHRWRFMGYTGWKCGQASWGQREDGAIVMTSGGLAHKAWNSLVPQAERITRIDLAVTIEISKPDPEVAHMCYRWICENTDISPNVKYTFITSLRSGDTLYCGRRTSPMFGRLYDKGAEQGDMPLGKLWRYEVEIKKPQATPRALALLDASYPEDAIKSYVYEWFEARQVPPLFNKGVNYAPVEVEARVTDDDRTIQWLSSQVRPAIIRLAKKGKFNKAIDALELSTIGKVVEEQS